MKNSGFTLIELSIVLVIIGLITGGILLGRDLIAASETRAQIAQIEKYNSAVNTFANKYGGIPGDLNLTLVSQFGFTAGTSCNGTSAKRDGNGLIEGWPGEPLVQGGGETGIFWQDISSAGLIDGEYPNSGAAPMNCTGTNYVLSLTPGTLYVGDYFPAAKIGHGNFVYVYTYTGSNWYGVSAISATGTAGGMSSTGTIPVIQAYNMDKKVDDGLPTTGTIQAVYISGNGTWPTVIWPSNNGTTDTTTTCYSGTAPNFAYSLSATANQGAGLNCGLSFRFQ